MNIFTIIYPLLSTNLTFHYILCLILHYRRSLDAGGGGGQVSLKKFPPFTQFISMAFETSFFFLRKVREAQKILNITHAVKNGGNHQQPETDEELSFVQFRKLDNAIYDLIMYNNNLRVILPYLVTNVTVLISHGWSQTRDLGQLSLNLLREMNGLTNILLCMDKEKDAEKKQNEDPEQVADNQSSKVVFGLNSEISMVVESDHPYDGAKQRCYKCVLPPSVKFIVIEFDEKCITAQIEDHVQIFAGNEMNTQVFDKYYQQKWFVIFLHLYYIIHTIYYA